MSKSNEVSSGLLNKRQVTGYNYLTVDSDGTLYLHKSKPTKIAYTVSNIQSAEVKQNIVTWESPSKKQVRIRREISISSDEPIKI